jgi:hypothetical protein
MCSGVHTIPKRRGLGRGEGGVQFQGQGAQNSSSTFSTFEAYLLLHKPHRGAPHVIGVLHVCLTDVEFPVARGIPVGLVQLRL